MNDTKDPGPRMPRRKVSAFGSARVSFDISAEIGVTDVQALRPAWTERQCAKLAPVLGGEALPSGVETTAESADWREAPLFVLSAGSAPAAGAWQPDSHAGATPLPHDDPSASASAGIFIARSNGRSWP